MTDDAVRHLPPGSRVEQVAGAGHFAHLERPRDVNDRILRWVTG